MAAYGGFAGQPAAQWQFRITGAVQRRTEDGITGRQVPGAHVENGIWRLAMGLEAWGYRVMYLKRFA